MVLFGLNIRVHKREIKPKGQFRMENLEKLTTLGTQDTRQTNQTQHNIVVDTIPLN